MKPYCIGCLYSRPLGATKGIHACHYYLDTGTKPPYTDTDCSARRVVTAEQMAAYTNERRVSRAVTAAKARFIEDDYIFDSRGALDGWTAEGG